MTRTTGNVATLATLATLLALTAAPAHAAPARATDQPVEHQQYAYAVLLAPGWSPAPGDGTADGSVVYENGAEQVRLAWHQRGVDRAPYTIGERVGTTTMDGDRAGVYDYQSIPTAVGPRVNGHFLSLSSTTLDDAELADLAGQVHRTAYATLEAGGWVATEDNQPDDEKLFYAGPDGTGVVLNWRPAADDGQAKYREGELVGRTRLDGDRADVYEEPAGSGYLTVVGPARRGRFLTLATTTLGLDDLEALAPHVRRR